MLYFIATEETDFINEMMTEEKAIKKAIALSKELNTKVWVINHTEDCEVAVFYNGKAI